MTGVKIHRDIKPENILVTMSAKRIVAKIGDLGSAIKLAGNFGGLSVDFNAESDLTHYVGSRWYALFEFDCMSGITSLVLCTGIELLKH